MKTRGYWFMTLGLAFLLAAVPAVPTVAGEAEQKASAAPAKTEQKEAAPQETKESPAAPAAPEKPAAARKPAGLVGAVVAAVPDSRTLVVDVPLGKDVLRVGAAVTGKTKITMNGAPASFDSLKEGGRVRIQFRRVAEGDEATRIEILRGPQG